MQKLLTVLMLFALAMTSAFAQNASEGTTITIPKIDVQIPPVPKVDVQVPAIPKVDVQVPGLPSSGNGAVVDDNQTLTIECKKEPVSIMGSHNTITIKGDCTDLSISGSDNTVIIDQVPTLSIMGEKNTVNVGTLGSASLLGENNKVTYTQGQNGDPKVSDLGEGNTVTKVGK